MYSILELPAATADAVLIAAAVFIAVFVVVLLLGTVFIRGASR